MKWIVKDSDVGIKIEVDVAFRGLQMVSAS